MKKSKSNQSIQDLKLLDSYLFGEVAEIPENAEYIAKSLLKEPLGVKLKRYRLCRRNNWQVLTDAKLLPAGERYKELPDYVSIWILSEDPFGLNRAVYTVRSKVEEVPDASFDDGVTKVFCMRMGKKAEVKS